MTDTDWRSEIEAVLLTQAGRMDMLTVQLAQLATRVDALALQVDRLIYGIVAGFTRRDEHARTTDDAIARIDRKLDELDALVRR